MYFPSSHLENLDKSSALYSYLIIINCKYCFWPSFPSYFPVLQFGLYLQPWELFFTYWTNGAPHLCRPLLHHSWRSQAAPRPTHLRQTRWWRRWWLEYLCHELCLTVCQVCTFGHSSDLPKDNRIFEQCSKRYFETAKNHVSTRCKRSVFFWSDIASVKVACELSQTVLRLIF